MLAIAESQDELDVFREQLHECEEELQRIDNEKILLVSPAGLLQGRWTSPSASRRCETAWARCSTILGSRPKLVARRIKSKRASSLCGTSPPNCRLSRSSMRRSNTRQRLRPPPAPRVAQILQRGRDRQREEEQRCKLVNQLRAQRQCNRLLRSQVHRSQMDPPKIGQLTENGPRRRAAGPRQFSTCPMPNLLDPATRSRDPQRGARQLPEHKVEKAGGATHRAGGGTSRHLRSTAGGTKLRG